jgi:hypothetical protein
MHFSLRSCTEHLVEYRQVSYELSKYDICDSKDHMYFSGSMEVIEVLSSDDEDIVDLCSDGEDDHDYADLRSHFHQQPLHHTCSDSEDDQDYGDLQNRFRQKPLHSVRTTDDDTSSDEEPIMLDVNGFLSTHQPYRPAQNRPATGNMSKFTSKDFSHQPIPSMTSVIDFKANSSPETPEKRHFTVDEKAVYEEALLVCMFG